MLIKYLEILFSPVFCTIDYAVQTPFNMIDEAFKLLITRIYPLMDDEISALQNMFTSKKVGKNGFILKKGEFTQSLFLLSPAFSGVTMLKT